MAWTPPLSLEERAKQWLLPPRLQLWWDVRRELRRGEREIALVPLLADPERVSLDIGANRGVWTEALRRHSRAVFAFEPNPKMFRMLSRGIGPGVTALPYALSDSAGTAELRVPRRRRGYSNQGATLAHASLGAMPFGSLEVERRRLDDLDLGDVGFIKLDVEGHELDVLRGGEALLARCRPTLIVEMEEKHTARPITALIADVCAYGYDAFCLRHGVLTRARDLDFQRHHAAPAGRRDYVFNWIFLPA